MFSRILITGGSGLLALNWAVTMRSSFAVTLGLHERSAELHNVDSVDINLDSEVQLNKVLDLIKPDIIIHSAGLTSVEKCELEPKLAKHVNVDLAVNIARACKRLDIKLVHISTDHLFKGDIPNVTENETVNPVNVYGKTKAEAEAEVLSINPAALIIRTNFYGWGPSYRQSFSDMIINNLRNQKEIGLFHDVFYTSILAEKLILTVHSLLDRNAAGIFNVVSDERISKYQFGLKIAKQFNLNTALIIPRSISSVPNLVKRPLDMSLSNAKVRKFLTSTIGSNDEHIARLKQQEQFNFSDEIISL